MAANPISSFRNNVYTIYAQTNLDTHFALVVADDDTVEDAKHKAVNAHRRCFPHIGDITVQSFKVKRKGCFFTLTDSMPVTSAFVGVKNLWYLYVDASFSPIRSTQNPLSLEAGTNIRPEVLCAGNDPSSEAERIKIGVGHISQSGKGNFLSSENHRPSTSDIDKGVESDLLEKPDLADERNEILKTNPKNKREKSKKRKKDTSCDDILEEDLQLVPTAKKSRSTKATLEGDNPCICMPNENASRLEIVTQENSLEGIKHISYAKLDGLPDKQLKNSKSAQGESEKEKNSLILEEKVDSTLVPSRENARHENSKEQATNINEDLIKDAALTISSQQTLGNLSVTEKEIQYRVVKEVGEGNSIPCPSLDKSHAKPAVVEAIGDADLDSRQDVDMGGAIGSELKRRVDTSEKTRGVRIRKGKKSKKDQAAVANEAERKVKDGDSSNPLDVSDIRETEGPGNERRKKSKKTKETDIRGRLHANNGDEEVTPFMPIHENSFDGDCPAVEVANKGSIPSQTEVENDMVESDRPAVEVDNKGSLPSQTEVENDMVESHGPEIISEAANTLSTINDLDVPDKLIEAVATEAQDPSVKRKKKGRKTKASKVKKNVSSATAEDVEGARDAVQFTDESHKALVQEYSGTEIKERENTLSQTAVHEASKLEDTTTSAAQESGQKNTFLPLSQTVSFPEAAENVDDHVERNSVVPPVLTPDTVIMDPGMNEQAANSEEPSFSTKRNEKEEKATPKKTRKPKLKKDSSSVNPLQEVMPEAENGNGVGGVPLQLPPLSTVIESPQPPSNVLNNVNGSKDEAFEVPHNVPENGNHEFLTPTKQLVEKKQDKETKLKKGRKTKAQGGDSVKSLDAKHKAEASAYKVSRRKTVDTAEGVKPLAHSVTAPTSSEANTESVKKPQGMDLNGSQNRKSLLAAPKTIFSDCSTESSEDIEDTRKLDSDATMSPSDSSSSSDRSVLNSPGNGSYARRKMEISGNSRLKSRKTMRKDLDLNTILRSSKSYKTAKLAASQSQPEDKETLPIQFHLDT